MIESDLSKVRVPHKQLIDIGFTEINIGMYWKYVDGVHIWRNYLYDSPLGIAITKRGREISYEKRTIAKKVAEIEARTPNESKLTIEELYKQRKDQELEVLREKRQGMEYLD